jgi:hypothetical protein
LSRSVEFPPRSVRPPDGRDFTVNKSTYYPHLIIENMKKTRNYLPQAYAPLLNWLTNFISYLIANLARFGIPTAKVNEFQTAQAGQNLTAYTASKSGGPYLMRRPRQRPT